MTGPVESRMGDVTTIGDAIVVSTGADDDDDDDDECATTLLLHQATATLNESSGKGLSDATLLEASIGEATIAASASRAASTIVGMSSGRTVGIVPNRVT
ncbi:hypothetical protein Tco_0395910 [Tanacetum coccineum]